MNQLWLKARTAWALGPISLYRYVAYQFGIRTGLNPVRRLHTTSPTGPFFRQPEAFVSHLTPPSAWREHAHYFSWFDVPLNGRPPHWHCNPFTGAAVNDPERPWWQIPDFDPTLGDIKSIWEASRFDWVLAYACRARAGEATAVDRLNSWLVDWLHHNPPYFGPNWKCGQEASIRLLHLIMAALILEQTTAPPTGLVDLVRLHLQRIFPTIQYALAQNNNHGTSEAAALFVGGSWLHRLTGERWAAKWEKDGRYWLENRAQTLIASDGSFSQYSVNYHRLLLDTFCMVELWRRQVDAAPFSERFLDRCRLATHWLYTFTDPNSGAAPNIGANDGARLLPLSPTGYHDYRPTVQLAASLFLGKAAYDSGPWNDRLRWLRVDMADTVLSPPTTCLFDQGGYAFLTNEQARLFVRYPRYRFRPGHADALHVDFWLNQENILRDAGSYSYAAEPQWQSYFRSCVAHNTIQFDDRDQMPRLGRFLYGAWLQTKRRELTGRAEETSFSAVYRDWQGAEHGRHVNLQPGALHIKDQVIGFRDKAILRWRLAPGGWRPLDDGWFHDGIMLRVTADVPIVRQELVEGWESRYYHKREPLPVLEVEIRQPGRLETVIHWL
jgi:hypothetical protein